MRYLRQGSLGTAEADGWRPSPLAARVYLKDLAAGQGWQMRLVRCDPGATLALGAADAAGFLFVLEGELVRDGRRLWPGAAWVEMAGGARGAARSEVGCTLLVFAPAET